MATIYLTEGTHLLDYAASTKRSARNGAVTTLTIKLAFDDPSDLGFVLRELAEVDRIKRDPRQPTFRGSAERELGRAIAAERAPLRLTHRRED